MRTHRWVLLAGCLTICLPALRAQVFVVGEKTATADITTAFKPTDIPLPTGKMTERGRRDLVRSLNAEQGFAHRALPIGVITLQANGNLLPEPDKYRQMIYQKGQSAAAGDRVVVTALDIKGDKIVVDLNGGPYAKHRFLSHVQFGNAPVAGNTGEQATGSRVTLVFPDGVPEISGPEVKALLEPVIDFGVKSSDQAYADTLPPRLRDAIAAHEVLVGMNHRMVLASLGAPENKIREQQSGDLNGARYEEWIYGHVPQTVKFIRFVGDHVSVVEIAAMGKPLEIHDKNELDGSETPTNTREIAMGDRQPGKEGEDTTASTSPPSLRLPGEAKDPANAQRKVQYPAEDSASRKADSQPIPAAPGSPADTDAPQTQQTAAPIPSASTQGVPAQPGQVPRTQ
ncbi:MAG: hypothetical protein PW789_02030 [Edaphobacter sp.]|uniref:hypothetical protein n=1 Tax=Edaphobacter sp. TaxID=1934404 RepID=UPI0023A71D05|nr:hypothetical protein [Edaphobacter sp.]MDE1175365.1 hypothetical protein [Edaphobacter sp.]